MTDLNVPKTADRIRFEHFFNDIQDITSRLENLKESLPNEISKQAINEFKNEAGSIRADLIELSRSHIQELEGSRNKIIDSLKSEINNNTISIANSVNNSFVKLIFLSFISSFFGGLLVWGLLGFIK